MTAVTTYMAARKVASRRPRRRHVVGFDDAGLPAFARQREPLTALPPGSLVDTFVHPHGLFRNVLVTGPLAVIGTQLVGDREAIVVRAEHPRRLEGPGGPAGPQHRGRHRPCHGLAAAADGAHR